MLVDDVTEMALAAERLPPKERAELLALLEATIGGESLHDFICRVAPDERPPRHLLPIIRLLEQARVKPIRVCISMPPGHAKTSTLLRAIVWWLTRSPADTCAYVTYNDDKARAKSMIAHDLANRIGLDLRADRDSLSEWRTVHGGGLIAAGAKGGLMGERVPGLLIYDDPYKDAREARSPAVNGDVIGRFKAAAFTRVKGGSVIVMHTRYADDDLIGHLTRDLGWPLLNVEAVCGEFGEVSNDPLGRAPGEAAWPECYPAEMCADTASCGHDGHLAEIRTTLGDWLWSSMYGGHPYPPTGGLFKPDKIRLIDAPPTSGRACRGWDLAATADHRADWTAGVKLRLVPSDSGGHRVVIEHVERHQYEPHDVEALLPRVANLDGFATTISIPQDPAAAGKSQARAFLRHLHGYTVKTSPERGDKVLRANPFAAQVGAGNVDMVRGEWNQALLDELRAFPGGRWDDQVDAASRAYAELALGAAAQSFAGSAPRVIRRDVDADAIVTNRGIARAPDRASPGAGALRGIARLTGRRT